MLYAMECWAVKNQYENKVSYVEMTDEDVVLDMW